MSESKQQQAVVKYFKLKYGAHTIFACANGAHIAGTAHQRMLKVAKMKREGMLPGVPDLCICVGKGGFHGLFIEMKDCGKTYCSVSKVQRQRMKGLNDDGYKAVWCAGSNAAIKEIDLYMGLK